MVFWSLKPAVRAFLGNAGGEGAREGRGASASTLPRASWAQASQDAREVAEQRGGKASSRNLDAGREDRYENLQISWKNYEKLRIFMNNLSEWL